jgi:hypothetical protein
LFVIPEGDLLLPLPSLSHTTNVISTEGGAFAAAVEIPVFRLFRRHQIKATHTKSAIYTTQSPKTPAKYIVKPQNQSTSTKQNRYTLQSSYPLSTKLNIRIK